ncbi:MAG: type II secretion system F family protein, partial [Sandaracinaceae bacterium]|nr:type II secretion system F family protein [Sandaracinaceae bacterium]
MTEAMRWGGIALAGLGGLAALVLALTDPSSRLSRGLSAYVQELERESRFLRLGTSGKRMAAYQALGVLGVVAVGVLLEDPIVALAVPLILVGPIVLLRRRHVQRVVKIEEQIDGWLVILANSLRAAPSLGDAIRSSAVLTGGPLAEELDIVLKEMQLGAPVDRALLDLGTRLKSRTVSGALAALLVARQTGGELSAILEETASSLREMIRLEGVLRAKTAEGRSQAYVLGALPFFLIGAIHYIDPAWLDPLMQTATGILVVMVSLALWLGAILMARRI